MPVREGSSQVVHRPQRQPGLAHPARAGERHQARLCQEPADGRQLALSPDEARQTVAGGRLRRPWPEGRRRQGQALPPWRLPARRGRSVARSRAAGRPRS
jgi:hypothetical protein